MKKNLNNIMKAVLITAITAMIFTSCKKDGGSGGNGGPVDYRDAPRKEVPAELVGTWYYVSVSSTNVEDNYGHSVPAWTFGATFGLKAGGTGFETINSSYTYVNSATQKEDVLTDGTYVIEKTGEKTYSFKYYPVQGKVYDNDKYVHDLTADKIYPNGSYNWTVTMGHDSKGDYFDTGDAKYYKD